MKELPKKAFEVSNIKKLSIPKFHCDNTIPFSEDLLLGVTIDKLKFDKQIANVTRKVSQQLVVLKRLRNIDLLM